MKLFFIAFGSLFFLYSCADLRTQTSKKNPDREKAQQLMIDMGKAHGIEHWEKVETYTVNFEDEFFGKIGKRSKPYPETKTEFELNYIPHSFDGRLTFFSGEWTDKSWGIQAWNTYETIGKDTPVFKKNKDAYFWIPTYQYFIEFPLRIQEATALAYAGEITIDGKVCDGVLASWGKTKPQKKIDQYLIWIERDTKRIYKLEYTVREYYSFLKGAVYFKDYKDFNGILLPTVLPVESNIVKGGLLHEMRIKDMKINLLSPADLRPNKNLSNIGDKKP